MKKLYSFLKINRILSFLMMGMLVSSLFSGSKAYGQTIIAINCGSDTEFTAADGTVYAADEYFDGGRTDNSFTGPKYTGDILGTDDDDLYKTYRATGYIELDDFFYNIPVDNGTYKVTLKFADYQQWQRNAGHLIIEGTQLLTNFVVQEVAGDPFVAFDTTFTIIVEDGELNMQFINDEVSVGDFFLNGLLIKEDVPYSLGINCGSDADYTAVDGKVYVADVYGSSGNPGNSFTGPKYTGDILNTEDDVLYQTYYKTGYTELDDFFYNIPLDEGTYEITLKFADYQQWQRNAGHLIIEGTQLLTSFLVQDVAGDPFVALDTTFTIKVEDGELNMQFINDEVSVGDFFINGIYIQELTEVYYTLETIAENGTISLDPVGGSYSSGSEVTLTAVPDYGWEFVEWTGDLEGVEDSTASTITVVIDKAKSITATFQELPTYTLTTNVTNGNIFLNPGPDIAGGKYFAGAVVKLSAQPNVGYIFTNWSGDLSGNENPATIVMDKDMNITAEMLLNVFSLTIDATNGSVNVYPSYGNGEFNGGTDLILEAIPEDGYRFSNWEGDLSHDQNPTSVTMDSAIHVVAVFELIPESYTLTTNATNGSVTLDPLPARDGTYEDGTEVTVTAVPDDGYEFSAWSGDITGSDNPASIKIDGNKSITAEFDVIISVANSLGIEQSSLAQNYPNPFAVETIIPYQVDRAAPIQLSIYNILGEKINTLVNDYQQPGSYEVKWNVVDANGTRLSQGVYFYRLEVDHKLVKIQKAVVSQ